MTEQEFKTILRQGEGYNLEFKRSINKDLPKEICSFVNASGGMVLIGVNDNNTVHGVKLTNKSSSALQNHISVINPTPEVEISEFLSNDKTIVILDCKPGKQKPYMALGSIYVRMGANAQKLISPNEIRSFFQEQSKIYFDQAAIPEFSFPDEFSNTSFEAYKKSVNIQSSNDNELILKNLRLLTEDNKLRNAGIMLFAHHPIKYFPHAAIRCILFKGNDKRFIADDKEFNGGLLQQFYSAVEYLKQKLNLTYTIESKEDTQRTEVLEIPLTVIREALINAIVHRDYDESGGKIHVEIFENRVEISNPGGLIAGIPQKQFGKRSLSRNPLIFGLFMRMRLAEQVGSGILRMQRTMLDAKLPAPGFQTDGIFVVSLYRPVDFEQWLLQHKKLTKNQAKILRAVYSNPKITYVELSEDVGLSTSAISNNMKKLRRLKIIERIGSDKSGSWSVQTQSGV